MCSDSDPLWYDRETADEEPGRLLRLVANIVSAIITTMEHTSRLRTRLFSRA